VGSTPATRTSLFDISSIGSTNMNPKKGYVPQEEKTYSLPETPEKEVKKVLLLDDDEALSWTLKEFLSTHGYTVTVVRNGVDGVKQVMAEDFDVIICDMIMPNLAGDKFFLAVERTKPHLCRRFIFISGHKGDPSVDAFIRKVKGLPLWKPFAPYQLLEQIKVIEARAQPPGVEPKPPSNSNSGGPTSTPGTGFYFHT
jgi:DNA-binding NtrC family response regulator